jgi:hypothetical protein
VLWLPEPHQFGRAGARTVTTVDVARAPAPSLMFKVEQNLKQYLNFSATYRQYNLNRKESDGNIYSKVVLTFTYDRRRRGLCWG